MITLFPAWLAWKNPGGTLTRHVIAASTMVFTALFIHLSGGRDEGHFHFFMMMAFVTLYFDWRVILTAIVVGALDHVFRTVMFPFSVFGVLESPWFQLFRHVLWVVFEGVVLVYAAVIIDRDKRRSALQLALSQSRETQIHSLMLENQRVSEERAVQEKEAREAAEAKGIADQQHSELAKEAALKESLAAQELNRKVDLLLTDLTKALKGNLNVQISVRGEDAIGRVVEALGTLG